MKRLSWAVCILILVAVGACRTSSPGGGPPGQPGAGGTPASPPPNPAPPGPGVTPAPTPGPAAGQA
jgi:hypothetical protein